MPRPAVKNRAAPGSVWARTNKARVERLVVAGLMTPAGLAVVEAAKADGSWSAFDDVDNLVMPDDLTAALAANPDAEQFFSGLSASMRRLSLCWIASAKRPETRASRIAKVVTDAAEGRARYSA